MSVPTLLSSHYPVTAAKYRNVRGTAHLHRIFGIRGDYSHANYTPFAFVACGFLLYVTLCTLFYEYLRK